MFLQDIWAFLVKLTLLVGKTIYVIGSYLSWDNLKAAWNNVYWFLKAYVYDVSWTTIEPFYKEGRQVVVSVGPLWRGVSRPFNFVRNLARDLFDLTLHLVDVARILIPLEHLITFWFVHVQWIPFFHLRSSMLRVLFGFWYAYAAASAWVQVWTLILDLFPIWQVLLGVEVELRVQGHHFLYVAASILAVWRLHMVIGSPSLHRVSEPSKVSSKCLEIEEDYLKEFGGSMHYVDGEFVGVDETGPKRKSEIKREEKLQKERTKEMKSKVEKAVQHFFDDHRNTCVFAEGDTIKYETPHADCSKMCAVMDEDAHAHGGDAKKFWSNRRFYGIIGNVIAKSLRKTKLLQGRSADAAMKEEARTRL